jgi:predicted amidohydrolase
MNSDERKERNLSQAERLITEAAGSSPDVVALPECFSFLASEKETLHTAESIPGSTTDMLSLLSRKFGFFILAGSLPERTSDPCRYRNTSVLISPDGTIKAHYSKIHLFDISIPDGVTNRESSHVIPGDTPVVVDTPLGELGLSICYDLRFPELYRILTLRGAKIVFVPSAFSSFTGKDHWEPLLRARAIENQIYVAAPAQCGWHQEKRCYGNSMIVDPWGTVIAKASDRESIVFADIDLEYLACIRLQNQCLNNIRANIGDILWKGSGQNS